MSETNGSGFPLDLTAKVEEALRAMKDYDPSLALARLEGELSVFERFHGMNTQEMRRRVSAEPPEMEESAAVLAWLMSDNQRRMIIEQNPDILKERKVKRILRGACATCGTQLTRYAGDRSECPACRRA